MQLNSMNSSWLNDDVSNRLMCFECTAAINILALVIAFFGIDAQITAGAGVCCVLAFRAVHHNNHHVIIFNQMQSLYVIAQNIHPGLQCFTLQVTNSTRQTRWQIRTIYKARSVTLTKGNAISGVVPVGLWRPCVLASLYTHSSQWCFGYTTVFRHVLYAHLEA